MPQLPDPALARNKRVPFLARYIDPLRAIMRDLAALCVVSKAVGARAQLILDSLLFIDDRGSGLEAAERRCLGHPRGGAQVRRCGVVNVRRETAIGELVARCTNLRSLVAEDPFQVALPPSCDTLIMPAFHSPGALQCTLAAVIQLRCLRMPGINLSRLDAHMRALIVACPDFDKASARRSLFDDDV